MRPVAQQSGVSDHYPAAQAGPCGPFGNPSFGDVGETRFDAIAISWL
jgi:hypothetical protein